MRLYFSHLLFIKSLDEKPDRQEGCGGFLLAVYSQRIQVHWVWQEVVSSRLSTRLKLEIVTSGEETARGDECSHNARAMKNCAVKKKYSQLTNEFLARWITRLITRVTRECFVIPAVWRRINVLTNAADGSDKKRDISIHEFHNKLAYRWPVRPRDRLSLYL